LATTTVVANYTQNFSMMQKWATESDRLKVVSIGLTEEAASNTWRIITSPANQRSARGIQGDVA